MPKNDHFTASLVELFKKNSISYVATSLFVASLWLPNISAFLKHPYLAGVFASIKPTEFFKEDRITTYEAFKEFCGRMYGLCPSYPQLEDMIPEADWGQVEFYYINRRYHIFYGTEISNVCDHLSAFDVVHCVFDDEYIREAERSPVSELRICLRLQDHIITGIQSQAPAEALSSIPTGHTEVPPETFWQEAKELYSKLDLREYMSEEVLEHYSVPLGLFDLAASQTDRLFTAYHDGAFLPYYAIKTEDRYLPILPRRYSPVLIEQWRKVFEKHRNNLNKKDVPPEFRAGIAVNAFIRTRIGREDLYQIVSAFTREGKPHDFVFHSALLTKNKLFLFHVLQPLLPDELPKDFEKMCEQMNEALDLLKKKPSLLMRAEGQGVEFLKADPTDTTQIEPILFVVAPQVSTGMYKLPATLPGELIGLDDFLMIIDELEDAEELADYSDFLKTQRGGIMPILNSFSDLFAAFKDAHGVMVGGAVQPNFIFLDPNSGSYYRYESLKKFWEQYPKGYFGNPRHHKIVKHTDKCIRLVLRGVRGFSFHFKIGKTEVSIWAPFDKLEYEQGRITDQLLRYLEDALSQNRIDLEKHPFFEKNSELRIAVFPVSFASSSDKEGSIGDLTPLLPQPDLWRSEISNLGKFPIIRMVFDDDQFVEELQQVKDASLEMKLATEILTKIDEVNPDPSTKLIAEKLDKKKTRLPRTLMRAMQKTVAFPNYIDPISPTPHEYKLARKRVSEIAKELGVAEGTYDGEKGIQLLNKIRDVLVQEIDAEVSKYDFASSIPFLIERADALENVKKRTRIELELSKDHQVDFDRTEAYAKEFEENHRLHGHCRYLIEKFVQLQPSGTKRMSEDNFRRLSGLVNWLHVLYHASDSLQYQTHASALIFNHESIVEVGFDVPDEKQDSYIKQVAGEELSPSGNKEDRVEGTTPIKTVVGELDSAFREDFGFSFRNLTHVLHALKKWSFLGDGEEEQSSYAATEDEIVERCLKNILEDITEADIRAVVKFLILSSAGVIQLQGQEEPCNDIPVWEHIKRLMRYDLRPLIFFDGKYHWGAYAARMAEHTWRRTLFDGSLPAAFVAPKTQVVLDKWSKEIQDGIEIKALEVSRRHTLYSESVDLHSRFPKSSYPSDLGDYDVLIYLPKSHSLLNVECKEIPHTHNFKDASRQRRRIFGWPKPRKDSHFPKILKREQYLRHNWQRLAADLKWPVDTSRPPDIINVYVTRHRNWWMKSPPNNIQAEFIRIDLLDEYLRKKEEEE